MRVLVITVRGETHHATETDEYSSRGNPFIVCNCGATAYGLTGIIHAHNRGDRAVPVQVVAQPEKPTGSRVIWNPPWETPQERREYLSRQLDRKGRPAWWVKAAEKTFCRLYGHGPSADGRSCYYCGAARKDKGRWHEPPAPEPPRPAIGSRPAPLVVRPGRPVRHHPPMSTVHGPDPIPPPPRRPAIESGPRHAREHPDVRPEDCPFCMGPPPDWRATPPPCTPHHRTNCSICARRT